VTLGRRDEAKARFLLQRGADPNARATFRKQLRGMGDAEKSRMREFRDATPIAYARRYQEPNWVSEASVTLLEEYGGTE
jgi:hypothetical protein